MAKSMVNLPFSRPPGATGRCAGLSDGLPGHQSQVAPDGDMERPLVGPLRNIWGAKKQSFKVIPCRSIEMS